MRILLIIFLLVMSNANALTQERTWTAPSTKEDGSVLNINEITHYRMYWLPSPREDVDKHYSVKIENNTPSRFMSEIITVNEPWNEICFTVVSYIEGGTLRSGLSNWICVNNKSAASPIIDLR